MPRIVVTIPAYNEEETISQVIKDIQLAMQGYDYVIQVVSDGSTDKTVAIARGLGVLVREKRHSGLADTFREEVKYAIENGANIIVHIDADGQYKAEEIPDLIKPITELHYDLVLGNRLNGRMEYMPISKKILNKLGSLYFSIRMLKYVPDMTTGFRAFNRDVAEIALRSGFTYTVEQIIKSYRYYNRVKSVPVTFRARQDGNSRLMKGRLDYIKKTIKNYRKMFKE